MNTRYRLAELTALIEEVEAHLLGDEVYRTVLVNTGDGNTPYNLSLGELLTQLHRFYYFRGTLTDDEKVMLDNAQASFVATTEALKSRYHQHLDREIQARLDALSWFLDECEDAPAECRDAFPTEIRNRQRIEELADALDDALPEETRKRMEQVDAKLRALTHEADFIWSQSLEPVYAADPYWYLYALP